MDTYRWPPGARGQHRYRCGAPSLPARQIRISQDRHLAYATIQFDQPRRPYPRRLHPREVVSRAQDMARPGFEVQLGGAPIEKVEKPAFGASEGLGILAAVIILLLAFGSVIAMLLPIASAILVCAITFGAVDLLSHGLIVPTFAPELAALVGCGVGIDYTLFVVTRYRSSLHEGSPPEAAVAVAMATSGRAVLFAGSTVLVVFLGLFLLGLPFIYGAALAAVIAVLIVMTASMTLLPRLPWASPATTSTASGSGGPPARLPPDLSCGLAGAARSSTGHQSPGGAALLVSMATLALPFLSLRLAYSDAGDDPASYTTRQAYDLLADGFGPGASGPLIIAVKVPGGQGKPVVSALATRLGAEPDVAFASAPRFDRTEKRRCINVIPDTSPQDGRTSALVRGGFPRRRRPRRHPGDPRYRAGRRPGHQSTPPTSPLAQAPACHRRRRRVVAAAAHGRLPLRPDPDHLRRDDLDLDWRRLRCHRRRVQWGWLGSGIDNGRTGSVDPWVPLFLFALLFGLSMDYQVFLLPNTRSVGGTRTIQRPPSPADSHVTGRIATSPPPPPS